MTESFAQYPDAAIVVVSRLGGEMYDLPATVESQGNAEETVNGSGFSQWLATSFNAATPTFYVTETGFTVKLGALKTVIEPWGMYIPSADSEEQPQTQEPAGEDIKLEIASSQEGKPFVLEFRADGTLTTGWTNYEQTMLEGKWTVTDGALALEMDYGYTVAENAEGGLDITVNYGQMGEKTYTMTADQAQALLG